jgi:hypothetical protein
VTRSTIPTSGRSDESRRARWATIFFLAVGAVFVAVCLPIVLRGAPLADDFVNCLEPQRGGLGAALSDSLHRLGALRRAHFVEIIVTTEVCQHLPFGVAILVPLALTLTVAFLLRGLLKDLGSPTPWPEIGGAFWLLQPLGTETALWPAAIHVSLGLALAVAALRLHRSGRHGWGTVAVVGAGLSVEQVLLALPLAVWLTTPPERRRRAVMATGGVVVVLLIAFVVWPGNDPRLQTSLAERVAGAFHDPGFLGSFPALGLGLHSIPLAVLWAFPLSVAVLAVGAVSGARAGPALLVPQPVRGGRRSVERALLGGLGLIVAANVPVVLSVPHQGSPRLFAPTWLVLAGLLGVIGPRFRVRRPKLWGVAAGVFAAGALLSLALSVSVRLASGNFSEFAEEQIAAGAPDGAVVAVCGVRRTVVEPAPRGAFALHELDYDWSAREALLFYTGRRATFVLSGELWEAPCPPAGRVVVFSFSDLVARWRRSG